jgi:hypothetical protein
VILFTLGFQRQQIAQNLPVQLISMPARGMTSSLRCAQILTQKLLYSRQEIAIFMAGATEFNQRKAL